MFESRCGLCCATCSGAAANGCAGCLHMKLPFWGGECAVKSCCEGRRLDHCGQCTQFPCPTLSGMGVAEGYDPAPRLARCRQWAEEEAVEQVSTMTTLGLL